MKSKYLFLLGTSLCCLFNSINTIHAQGSAFTYQGRLNNNGLPASGKYDLRFTIYDSGGGPTIVAGPVTNSAVAVSNGLFVVSLDFGASVFTGPARWLDIAVRTNGSGTFAALNPRQALTPSPYAIFANTASNVVSGSVVKSLNNLKDNVTLAPGTNVTITPSGNTLTIASAGAGGSGIWNLNGSDTYYNAGKVGIGTTVPATPLEANGIVRSTRSGLAIQYIQLDGGDPASIKLTAQSAVAAEKTLLIQNLSGEGTPGANNSIQFAVGATASPSAKMTITKDGNVGIGTTAPTAGVRLEVVGATRLTTGGSGGAIGFGAPNAETGMSISGVNRADVRFDGSTLKLLAGTGVGPPSSFNGIAINTNGNVGIGTTTPVAKLHVETSQANTAAVYGNATGAGGAGVYGQSVAGAAVHAEGNATQARDKGGFVKAMLYVNQDGTIARCYNGITDSSTGGCGFTVNHFGPGDYYVDFSFQVDDRFVSVTPRNPLNIHAGVCAAFRFEVGLPNQVHVQTYVTDIETDGDDTPFMIIIY